MSENDSTERKQIFVGSVRKCPSCGAQISTDTAKCPSCGFVIEKEHVSSAMDEFVQKFISLKSDAEKKEFIESYPVPNNKEDIRGLLNYAASQRDKDYPNAATKVFWVNAWNNKCRLIVNQAFDAFGADAEFTQYLTSYRAGVETSSKENKKLGTKLRLAKLAKQAAMVLVVLAVVGGISVLVAADKKKKAAAEAARQELIAGCIVPKENISLGKQSWAFKAASDATVTTTAISQRVETDAKEPVWCLDTTVTFTVFVKDKMFDDCVETVKKAHPDYYGKPENLAKGFWFRVDPEDIESNYQSKSVTKHSFDNIVTIAEKMKATKESGFEAEVTIRLTQIAGSKQECEDLAIALHQSGTFDFNVKAFYEEYYEQARRKRITDEYLKSRN